MNIWKTEKNIHENSKNKSGNTDIHNCYFTNDVNQNTEVLINDKTWE